MNIILLSGGSGKRLWPLSNDVRSKQFLKVFRREDGTEESMVQRVYRMIRETDPEASVTIATSESQVASIQDQLDERIGISIEPCRRDTFPAIALATAYLHDVMGVPAEEAVVVCPVDPYVEIEYYQMMERLCKQAMKGEANLVLMGIEPTYPSAKYGYIIPESRAQVSGVTAYKEKPDMKTAEGYLAQGALWNAGVFTYKLKYVLEIAEKEFGTASYEELYAKYDTLTKISFDYAVVEKEPSIQVMRFAGEWIDLGTWNTLTEAMKDEFIGNVTAVDCENTHAINELRLPMVVLGVKDVAVAATPDGILVTDKMESYRIKDYVPAQRPMYEKRIWGEYQVLDYRLLANGDHVLTKHLTILKGKHISYQVHACRSENWNILEGKGYLIIDGVRRPVTTGDIAHISPGTKHAIHAEEKMQIIEVQIGSALVEEDIQRLNWDWDESARE